MRIIHNPTRKRGTSNNIPRLRIGLRKTAYILPHFTPEGIEKDRIRSQWLNRVGIEVIRFTSHEIENDTQRVLFAIDVALKRLLAGRTSSSPNPFSSRGSRGGEGELEHQFRDVQS